MTKISSSLTGAPLNVSLAVTSPAIPPVKPLTGEPLKSSGIAAMVAGYEGMQRPGWEASGASGPVTIGEVGCSAGAGLAATTTE